MPKKLVWTMAAMTLVLVGTGGYWILSGFSMDGTVTYGLEASGQPQHADPSWRYKAGQILLPLLYSHDTRYAALYREEAFPAVRPGATEDEIRTALGSPLDRRRLQDGHLIWHYSMPGPNTQDFLVRIVEFGTDGKVARTRSEFYVD